MLLRGGVVVPVAAPAAAFAVGAEEEAISTAGELEEVAPASGLLLVQLVTAVAALLPSPESARLP